jgi:hypothetical protein
MNERFDEIVRQTRLYNQSVYDNGEGGWIVQTAELKKFAELIVRECLRIVDENTYGPGGLYDYSYTNEKAAADDRATAIYTNIREHFGVK